MRLAATLVVIAAVSAALSAQMDLSQVSGQPLPSADLPVGTVTVRVVRGAITNNVAGQAVDVTVDGAVRRLTTDTGGRVEVTGLKPGAQVKAVAVVDGERLESKAFAIGTTGIRVMLVAKAAGGATAPAEAAAPAVSAAVAFSPESRVVAEMVDDRLNIYFLMDVLNPGTTPVDTGGPLILELPREALGAGLLQDATKQATVNGTHVIITGPFPPGKTSVRLGFELPAPNGTARIEAKLPASLPQVIVIVSQLGGLALTSPQITNTRELTDEGQLILVGTGPALQAGQTLQFEITGLPHHPVWPRSLALVLAGVILTAGIWGAVTPRS